MRLTQLLPCVLLAARVLTAQMTEEDRQHLLVHFQMTGQWLADEVRGLSPAQLEYRASPDHWTIRECVSHLGGSGSGVIPAARRIFSIAATVTGDGL